MKNIKVSIVVIYKNNEETIKNCLESILNQNFKDFEIICVNNGSNDKSEEIVQGIKEGKANILLLKLPTEHNIEEVKRIAISIANGEYICFIEPNQVIYEIFPGGIKTDSFNPEPSKIDIKTGEIYRRDFLENINIIDKLIDIKIETKAKELSNIVEKSEKNNIDNLNLNMEDIKLKLNNVYDYINSEINIKGGEINNVYAELNKNYKYTDNCKEEIKKDLYQSLNEEMQAVKNHISEVESNLISENKEMKNFLHNKTNEIEEKINRIQIVDGNIIQIEKMRYEEVKEIVESCLDRVYVKINEMNTELYNELSNIRNDFDVKISNLKDKLTEK